MLYIGVGKHVQMYYDQNDANICMNKYLYGCLMFAHNVWWPS